MFDVIMLVLWMAVGMLTLCSSRPISKTSYFCTWGVVVLLYISKIIA